MSNRADDERANNRVESWLALAYFLAYMGYLFIHPESELTHWLSLVILPFLLLFLYRRLSSSSVTFRSLLESVGLAKGNLTRGLLWAVLLGVGLSILQLFLSRRSSQIIELIHSGKAFYLFLLVVALMLATAGFTEEFFFRGILQTRLARLLKSKLLAVVVTSICFGLYHLPYAYLNPRWPSHGNWAAAFSLSLGQGIPVGLILGALYIRSRNNLLACVILHSLINTLPAMTMIRMRGPLNSVGEVETVSRFAAGFVST